MLLRHYGFAGPATITKVHQIAAPQVAVSIISLTCVSGIEHVLKFLY